MELVRRVNEAFNPLIQLLRPISPIAWIPVAIVLFGVGNLAPVFLVFLASIFPIAVTAQNGVASVPPMFLRAARNFGLGPLQLLWRVLLPATLPQILTGLRIALGIASPDASLVSRVLMASIFLISPSTCSRDRARTTTARFSTLTEPQVPSILAMT